MIIKIEAKIVLGFYISNAQCIKYVEKSATSSILLMHVVQNIRSYWFMKLSLDFLHLQGARCCTLVWFAAAPCSLATSAADIHVGYQLLTSVWDRRQWLLINKRLPLHPPYQDFRRMQNWVLQMGSPPHYSLIMTMLNVNVVRTSGRWQSLYCYAPDEHAWSDFVDAVNIQGAINFAEKNLCIVNGAVTKDNVSTTPTQQMVLLYKPGVYPATPAGGVLPSWKIILPPCLLYTSDAADE